MPTISPDRDYTASGEYRVREIGEIGYFARFQGMYIPYATGGLAPGFATDITTTSSPGGKSRKIDFKASLTTFGGEELESIDGFDIYRNGVRIHTQKGLERGRQLLLKTIPCLTPGNTATTLSATATSMAAVSKSPAFAFVGFDRPAPVSGITVEVGDDFQSTSISWEALKATGSPRRDFRPCRESLMTSHACPTTLLWPLTLQRHHTPTS